MGEDPAARACSPGDAGDLDPAAGSLALGAHQCHKDPWLSEERDGGGDDDDDEDDERPGSQQVHCLCIQPCIRDNPAHKQRPLFLRH